MVGPASAKFVLLGDEPISFQKRVRESESGFERDQPVVVDYGETGEIMSAFICSW